MGERESSGSDGKTNVNHPGSNTVAFIVQNIVELQLKLNVKYQSSTL